MPAQGGAIRMADGALVDAGAARIDLSADEDLVLGQVVTTFAGLAAFGERGAFVDAGDTGLVDLRAQQAVFQTYLGVGVDNPLEADVQTLAAHNRGQGGFKLVNHHVGGLTVGEVEGVSGILLGTFSAPSNVGGDIDLVSGSWLSIEQPVRNFGGRSHAVAFGASWRPGHSSTGSESRVAMGGSCCLPDRI